MRDETITLKRSLYDDYRREIKSNIIFGAVSAALLLILAAIVFVSNFVFLKVYVQGSSMYPTLKSGEVVLLNTYRTPSYGDIIVISGEKANGDWLIKRAIAFGGDTVKIEGGDIYLKKAGEAEFSEQPLYEPYLAEGIKTYYPKVNDKNDTAQKIFEISENEIFYLGDNRQNSSDSRSEFGTCTSSQIVGVVSEFALKIKGINTFFGKAVSSVNRIFG